SAEQVARPGRKRRVVRADAAAESPAGLADDVLPAEAARVAAGRPLELGADALLEIARREQPHRDAGAAAQAAGVASREIDRSCPVRLAVLLGRHHGNDVASRVVGLARRRRSELDEATVEGV